MSIATSSTPGERELLVAARSGDQDAFRDLVEAYRPQLHAHCYRMLGSVHDAEDALQDALLRAWRGLPRFEGRSSVRSWLYTIATNTCLTALARRPKRILPVDYGPSSDPHGEPAGPLVESAWVEPYPDERHGLEDGYAGPEARYEVRESVELAFIAALQRVPARQRAALILRDVLGFSAREAAETLGASVASVDSALQRARKSLDDRIPDRSQQATLRSLGDRRLREVVERYTEAMEQGNLDSMITMLTEDAAWSMPPMPTWFRGHEAISGFLTKCPFRERWRHLPTRANGQLAVGCYRWDEEKGSYEGWVLDVLTLRGDRIAEVTAFIDPSVFGRFGLPDRLEK
jgi:RNA polymerase sigma-70 factor (ECF subfamily)